MLRLQQTSKKLRNASIFSGIVFPDALAQLLSGSTTPISQNFRQHNFRAHNFDHVSVPANEGTWTTTEIGNFPIALYDPDGPMTTNGDTIPGSDGTGYVLIDDQNMVHG